MNRMYAASTRLEMTPELKEYLGQYIGFYNRIHRRMYHDLINGFAASFSKISEYITYICKRYGILKRTANSIRHDMQGRIEAYRASRNTALIQLSGKIKAVEAKIRKLGNRIRGLMPLVARNDATVKQANEYRKKKQSLYHARNKLNRLRQKHDKLQDDIRKDKIAICFGSRKAFDKQFRLAVNGYKSHAGWRNDFRKQRDRGIFFLGSSDEKQGNQLLQLYPCPDGTFRMCLSIDKPFRKGVRQICLDGVKFPFMGDELRDILQGKSPVTYRISRKGRKWYLTAMFSMETERVTSPDMGAVGIDYNDGFLETAETNESGNLVSGRHVKLCRHGTGNAAESEIKEKLSSVVRYALSVGKDIVVEDLDFMKKKSLMLKGRRDAGYNRMLHLFDYHRYLFVLENLCIKYGVGFRKVNPAYTSQIGKQKYAGRKKLTVHRAAAYVIARRGQGFKDTLAA